MTGQTIYAIEEDELGLLWIATNSGLTRLNPITSKITIFDKMDGLLDNDFNLHASLKDKNGYLYFGGFFGFNRFEPRQFVQELDPPLIRLVKISVSNSRLPFDPIYADLPKLTVEHHDHSVDFEFSTMDISSPGRSRYKYRLEGFASEWIDNGYRNSATFTNLPAGDYVFRVIGANSSGVWNYEGISLPIKILPAPWLTWWAISSYCLSLIALIALIKRYYDARLLNTEAKNQVKLMTNTAMAAMDDLQEQLFNEHQLVRNLRKHASRAIETVESLLSADAGEELDGRALKALEKASGRLKSLKAVESAVYFHGDQLRVNFRDAVDRLFADLFEGQPRNYCELVLANEVTEELLQVDLATQLILLVYEILQHNVPHAFEATEGIQCLHLKLDKTMSAGKLTIEFSDMGRELSDSFDRLNPNSKDMETITKLVQCLAGTLTVNIDNGTRFTIRFPLKESNS